MDSESDILELSSKLIAPEDNSQATINRLRHFAMQSTQPLLRKSATIGLTKIKGSAAILSMTEILLTPDESLEKGGIVRRLATLSESGGDLVLLVSIFTDPSLFHIKLSALLKSYQEADNKVLVRTMFEIMRFAPTTDAISRYADDILSILDMSGDKRAKAAGVLARALCSALDQGDYIQPPNPARLADAYKLADEIMPGLVNLINIQLDLRLRNPIEPKPRGINNHLGQR